MAMVNGHWTTGNEESCAVVVEQLEGSIERVNAWIRNGEIVAINIDPLRRTTAWLNWNSMTNGWNSIRKTKSPVNVNWHRASKYISIYLSLRRRWEKKRRRKGSDGTSEFHRRHLTRLWSVFPRCSLESVGSQIEQLIDKYIINTVQQRDQSIAWHSSWLHLSHSGFYHKGRCNFKNDKSQRKKTESEGHRAIMLMRFFSLLFHPLVRMVTRSRQTADRKTRERELSGSLTNNSLDRDREGERATVRQ